MKRDMREEIADILDKERKWPDAPETAGAIVDALPSMVVPLVWTETSASSGGWMVHHTGEGANGASYIVRAAGYDDPVGILDHRSYFSTVEAAKAAAQAHHVTQVMAAFGINT